MENKFCLRDLAIAGLKILEQLEALKFVNILCFWQKQLCFYQILKTSCGFSTMNENIFSELRTGPRILNLKFNWGIILLLGAFIIWYIYMKTTFWFWIWNQIIVIWSIFLYECKIKKFWLRDLAIAGLKILGQLEALKFGNILCFWQKQLCFYHILKTSCGFSTMSENIFSELRTGPRILNLKFNWGIILLLGAFIIWYIYENNLLILNLK